MRDVGIVTLLSVIATAAAPVLPATRSAALVTGKSTQQFAGCFVSVQEDSSAPWSFVPNDKGGTFSNLGAAGVSNPYFVVISDRGQHREVRLENASAGTPEARGVSECI